MGVRPTEMGNNRIRNLMPSAKRTGSLPWVVTARPRGLSILVAPGAAARRHYLSARRHTPNLESRERPPRGLEPAIKGESDDHLEKAFKRGRHCAGDLGC